ncbi:hypothetical protein ACS0TY_009093 [Phlomoides rotata]
MCSGDPTVYEKYWKRLSDLNITISCDQSLSYFANTKHVCWFMMPKLEEEIKILHNVVGNATVENRHIVVGTGSSQLIQAALYALSDTLDQSNPIPVIAAAPYYSTYKEQTNLLQSRLFKWFGDAYEFDKDEPYIELVTSPNNPDGSLREPVVNKAKGKVIYDLAYYWPQYTAITSSMDHDIMLFTLSKSTGHAGSRIGWAIIKDEEVAKKMVKFITVSSIGVSKEAQLRAASLLEIISASCQRNKAPKFDNFFECSRLLMTERWNKFRNAAIGENEELLHFPELPLHYCIFAKKSVETYPAFAWLKCNDGIDCEKMLKEYKVLGRGGSAFGRGPEYVRLSMVGRDEDFDEFLNRLPAIMERLLAAHHH